VTPVGTPLGDFIRAKRDATPPEAVGLPRGARRRVPGLRRSELAALAGISVEYLVRIEQGRDRNPSPPLVNMIADALRLDATERWHLRQLAKAGASTCVAVLSDVEVEVRPTLRAVIDQLEPGVALVTNRLGDVLAHTSGFELLAGPSGLLDPPAPNLTRFVFTDERARELFPDWDAVADERVIELTLGPATERVERFIAEMEEAAGDEFTSRVRLYDVPRRGVQRWRHPDAGDLRFEREVLEVGPPGAQQLVVLVPADDATADAFDQLRRDAAGGLRAVG